MGTKRASIEKSVNLALQGGGAHGAFTWGVMDKLFEDDRLWIQSISGTSAGAMNAVVAAHGMNQDGAVGARAALEDFWRRISDAGRFSPLKRSPLDMWLGNWSLDTSPGYLLYDIFGRLHSPYDINPGNYNPIRPILEACVDFKQIREAADDFTLFVSATNVETGRVRVFHRRELTIEMVLASACLPQMFQAVEINGQYFWDGGYMGNPMLTPIIHHSPVKDILLIQINPIFRPGPPRSAQEINNRINEISFNASLLRELRAIRDRNALIEAGELSPDRFQPTHIHMIEARKRMRPLGASSKLNTEWAFLRHLFEIGRDAATHWLENHYDDLGRCCSLNLDRLFEIDD